MLKHTLQVHSSFTWNAHMTFIKNCVLDRIYTCGNRLSIGHCSFFFFSSILSSMAYFWCSLILITNPIFSVQLPISPSPNPLHSSIRMLPDLLIHSYFCNYSRCYWHLLDPVYPFINVSIKLYSLYCYLPKSM